MEQWKDVIGFEGKYQISNHGQLKSLERKVKCKNGTRVVKNKILSPIFSATGYFNVRVKNASGEVVALFVHHQVAKHFIGERPDGMVIDHIDGNPRNNHVSNLRYVSQATNLQKRKDAKLTEEKVKQIKELLQTKKQREIAAMFGVRQSLISRINTGGRWSSV